ncbi:unnamed protein product [Cuscuta campestris]|uniref:Uncharacterized protein n=1 Tax=Cuscuta campestris TaxID=132261 RepID=A0A484MX14_9ASTE|nr:unnamed protein product [Cuscuta campestris]
MDLNLSSLSGTIALEISRCKLLTFVYLSRNQLYGEISIEITGMRSYLACSLEKAIDACAWKLTAFQRLDFTCDDVLDYLKKDNFIGKGGAGIIYNELMPNGEQVAVNRFPAMSHGFT